MKVALLLCALALLTAVTPAAGASVTTTTLPNCMEYPRPPGPCIDDVVIPAPYSSTAAPDRLAADTPSSSAAVDPPAPAPPAPNPLPGAAVLVLQILAGLLGGWGLAWLVQ